MFIKIFHISIFLKYLEPLKKNNMHAGLVYIAGTAGQIVVHQAISPIGASRISLLASFSCIKAIHPINEDKGVPI